MTQTSASGVTPAAGVAPLAVELTGVHKHFGRVHAVNGVNLDLSSGEIVAILGPNGAGKTSTIDIILGLSQADTGRVKVFGMEPRQAINRGLVSAVMQTGGLLRDLTVAETVEYTASLFASTQDLGTVLRQAGITDIADRRVGKCSGGEQQRLRFALALLSNPELLILDEPTTGMDVEGRRGFWATIRKDAEQGRTVLFATHYLEEADAYADRIILMAHGRVVADGPPTEIKAMVGLRHIRATLPDADLADLGALPGVTRAERHGESVSLSCSDSDSAIRALLMRYPDASDIEIAGAGLEDAFVELTAKGEE